MLLIRLFGEFQCLHNGQPVPALYSPRLKSFLAYLVLHRTTPISRQQMAFHFWPDSTESQARTNLRNLLAQLRTILPDSSQFLQSEVQTIQWRLDASFTLDVADFQAAIEHVHQASELASRKQLLTQAVACYQGELLPGCYDDWILPLREKFNHLYLQALENLSEVLEQMRDYRTALTVAQQLLQADPLRESSYARLIHLHAATGDRATALRVYHTCATTLMHELGVEPSSAIRLIYERLLNLESNENPTLSVPVAAPLLGREVTWKQLQESWQQASRGQLRFVLLSGEAGIGKTRLAEALLEWCSRHGIATATARCYSAAGRLALSPVIDWLRSTFFRSAIVALEPTQRLDLARLLPELTNSELPTALPTFNSDTWHRQRLFDVLARLVRWKEQPILLFIDDLQWCDEETLDWLHYLLRTQPRARLLLLATLRSEEVQPGQALHQLLLELQRSDELREIELERFDLATTTRLAENLTGKALDANTAADLYAQTEGNPLFIVETIRSQINETQHPLHSASATLARRSPLPPKVYAVIEARLARLSPAARSLADVAAVIGRSFTVQTLTLASEQREDTLTLGLDELWQNKIVRTQDADAYDFSHDKIREAALTSLSPAWRRLLHQRVAKALSIIHASQLDQVSGQLAHHHEKGGQVLSAIHFYQRAAAHENRLFALSHAIDFLQRALALLPRVTDEYERNQNELTIQVALAPLLLAKRGYGAPEVEPALRRAYDLCLQQGESEQLFRVLGGLGRYYIVQPNLQASLEVGQRMLKMANEAQNPAMLVEAHNSLGATYFQRGEITSAYEHLTAAITLYDKVIHPEHALIYGQDARVVSYARRAWALCLLGQTTAARENADCALHLVADEVNHPFSRAITFAHVALLYQMLGEVDAVHHYAQLASELAHEQGFPFFLGMATQLWGWALVKKDKSKEGMEKLQSGLVTFRGTGAQLGLPYFALLHAEALAHTGCTDEASAKLAEGLAWIARTHERWIEPRLRELQLQYRQK